MAESTITIRVLKDGASYREQYGSGLGEWITHELPVSAVRALPADQAQALIDTKLAEQCNPDGSSLDATPVVPVSKLDAKVEAKAEAKAEQKVSPK